MHFNRLAENLKNASFFYSVPLNFAFVSVVILCCYPYFNLSYIYFYLHLQKHCYFPCKILFNLSFKTTAYSIHLVITLLWNGLGKRKKTAALYCGGHIFLADYMVGFVITKLMQIAKFIIKILLCVFWLYYMNHYCEKKKKNSNNNSLFTKKLRMEMFIDVCEM